MLCVFSTKELDFRGRKGGVSENPTMDTPIPLSPKHLCSDNVTKKLPPLFISVFCVRFFSFIAPSVPFEACAGAGVGHQEPPHPSPIAQGNVGCQVRPRWGGVSSVTYLCSTLCSASLENAGISLIKHNADLVVIFVSTPLSPLCSPLLVTVCIIIYCYQGIWFDQ